MSDPNPTNQKPFHHLVQLSYANALFAEQSVLLVGHDFSLAAFIASVGANVVAVDAKEPDPPWPQLRADDGMACHVMPLENLAFNDGVFGAAVIPNLSALKNPAAVLAEAGRVLGRQGHLIVATPNKPVVGEDVFPIDYYKFYEMLSDTFPVVQMIGQSLFNGYAVADLSDENGELEVSFNSELLGNEAEDIAWFAAICGTKKAGIEPYSIVQVPSSASACGSEVLLQLEEELKSAKRELGNRGVRIESLEKKLEEELMQSEAARERAVKLSKELDNERKAVTKKTLEDEFSKRSADIDLAGALNSAKKEAKLADERAQSAETARDELIERMRQDAAEIDKLRRKLTDLETKPKRDLEAEKRARLADERAQSAEAARDQLIERMRQDAAELDKLRDKIEALETKAQQATHNGETEKRARLADERAQSAEAARDQLIERMRQDKAELDKLRFQHDQCGPTIEVLRKSEAALRLEADKLLEEKETLKRKDISVQEEIAALLETIKMLRDETSALRRQPVEATMEMTAAESSETLGASDSMVEDEIAALGNENELLEKRLASAAEEKHAAEEEVRRLGALIRDLIVKIETIEQAKIESNEPYRAESGNISSPSAIKELETEMAALWGAKAGEHRARVEAELELTGKMLELKTMKDHLADANVQLKTRDEELKRLAEEKDRLEDALSSMMSKCTAMKAAFGEEHDTRRQNLEMRIAEIETELQASKWRADEMAARKTDAESKLDALNAKLLELESDNHKLSTILDSTKRRERMLDEENESLNSRAKSLRADLEEAQRRRESLSCDIAALQAERERMTETLRDLEKRLEEERGRREQVEKELNTVEENADKVKGSLAGAEVELKGAHDKISDLTRIVDSLKDESGRIAELMGALDRKQSEVTSLRESLSLKESALAAEIKRNGALQEALDSSRAELNSESEMTRLAGADAARVSGEALSLREKVDRSAQALVERNAEIEAGLRVILELREDVVRLSSKLDAERFQDNNTAGLSRELDELRKESQTLSSELSVSISELERKKSELDEKKSALVQIESELGHKDAAFREKEAALKEREAELEQKEAALSDKTAVLESMKKKELKLMAELAERRMEIEESAETMSEMEAKIVAVNQAKVGLSVELAEAISNSERLSREVVELRRQQAASMSESASLKLKIEQLNAQCLEQADFAEKLKTLTEESASIRKSISEKESLINSLTEQLEERERRTAKLERQTRALSEQIEEHEGDVAAWDMELKLRSARISQLEKELAESKNK
jgi:chromosome segregation ATPase/SAM-dependent methyltransferase